ncbi:MAG: UTP--glucose-1-phosphate uridylyltransferase GalU [Lysobacterales bacterium]
MRVRKAVFPVAGLGTRLLPATKVLAKEMLPIIDKPLIQFAVDEAIAAGCDTLVFVTNRYKHAIADYFDRSYELEYTLAKAGKQQLLDVIHNILPAHVRCVFVTQREPLGLGHAVLCAQPAIGNEPFAVLLPDDLLLSRGKPVLAQMTEVAERMAPAALGAVERVPREQVSRYGIVDIEATDDRAARMRRVVEKPSVDEAPSDLAIVGRYLFDPQIFDLLAETRPGVGGEIQLTDAIATLIQRAPVLAYRFDGHRHDCGNRAGVVQATLDLALQSDDTRQVLREFFANRSSEF